MSYAKSNDTLGRPSAAQEIRAAADPLLVFVFKGSEVLLAPIFIQSLKNWGGIRREPFGDAPKTFLRRSNWTALGRPWDIFCTSLSVQFNMKSCRGTASL